MNRDFINKRFEGDWGFEPNLKTFEIINEIKCKKCLLIQRNKEWHIEKCSLVEWYWVGIKNFFFPPKPIK